ncbi:MAG: HAD-IA family hydrolase [Pleurocapsa sp.]
MFKSITHVIYDLDGLLLDTESLNERVNQIIVQHYGKTFDLAIKMKIAGRSTSDSAEIIVNTLKLPVTPAEYLEQRNRLLQPLYPTSNPLPGTVKLTQHLARYQISQAIASSSFRRNYEMKTTRHTEWFKIFNLAVLGDDPELINGKPAPDIFLLAAQRLGTSPDNCLVFEDSVAGMKAAKAAGMSVVVIPDPVFDRKLFQDADEVLNSMAEFQPQLWNLPGLEN